MASIQPPKISGILIPDANALYTANDLAVVDPAFTKGLDEMGWRAYGLKLAIPRVALAEVAFKKCWKAVAIHAKAEDAFRRAQSVAANVCGDKAAHSSQLLTEKLIRRKVKRQLLLWCKNYDAEIVKPPLKDIDWKRTVTDSLWRRPPFSPYSEDGKSEKGFRDALILETLASIAAKNPTQSITFITKDELLSQAVKARLDETSLVIHATSGEYFSFIKLERENFAKAVIDEIYAAAPKAFFTEGDPDCVYNANNVVGKLRSEFTSEFGKPHQPYTSPLNAVLGGEWAPITDELVSLGDTEIVSYNQPRVYFKTAVKFGQLHAPRDNPWLKEEITILSFSVFWSADVELYEAKLTNLSYDSAAFEGRAAELATPRNTAAFGIDWATIPSHTRNAAITSYLSRLGQPPT
jgi:PIN domain